MLLAKDFKTAVAVVIAVAGLLGFGTANAAVHLSEDNAGGDAASNPIFFAAELYPGILPDSPSREGGTPIATTTEEYSAAVAIGNLGTDATTGGGVDLALLNDDRYFIRFDLTGGAKFSANFDGDPIIRRGATALYTATQRVRGGRDDDASGIWSFSVCGTGDTCTGSNPGLGQQTDSATVTEGDFVVDIPVPAGEWTVEMSRNALRDADIMLPRGASATERSCYSLRFRLYDNQTSARNALDAVIDAQAVFMCLVPTLSASVTAPQTLTASVAEGFRRFLGDSPASGRLATANVAVAKTASWTRASVPPARANIPIQDPEDGDAFADGDVLKDVEFSLTGTFTHSSPFGFGEFKLGSTTMTRLDAAGDEITTAANKTAEGKASTAEVMATVTTAGMHAITVDVSGNNASSDENIYEAIGAGSYMAAYEIDQVDPGSKQGNEQNPEGGSALKAGTIMRDGTTVRIGYLQTITELERNGDTIGWNQRLVITNHGSISADVTLGDFKAEGDAEVMCKAADPMNSMHMMDGEPMWTCNDDNDMVMTTIAANSQLVLRVADIIEGANRTAGMVTIAQDSSQISIASTHVTLPGGQTDTVRYWPLQ